MSAEELREVRAQFPALVAADSDDSEHGGYGKLIHS